MERKSCILHLTILHYLAFAFEEYLNERCSTTICMSFHPYLFAEQGELLIFHPIPNLKLMPFAIYYFLCHFIIATHFPLYVVFVFLVSCNCTAGGLSGHERAPTQVITRNVMSDVCIAKQIIYCCCCSLSASGSCRLRCVRGRVRG